MKVMDIMTTSLNSIQSGSTVREAAVKMAEENIGAIPVLKGEKVIGLVTDRDMVVRGLASGLGSGDAIDRVMTERIHSCTAEEDVDQALNIMEKNQVRRLLVTDHGGSVAGIISLGDLALATNPERAGEGLRQVSRPG